MKSGAASKLRFCDLDVAQDESLWNRGFQEIGMVTDAREKKLRKLSSGDIDI